MVFTTFTPLRHVFVITIISLALQRKAFYANVGREGQLMNWLHCFLQKCLVVILPIWKRKFQWSCLRRVELSFFFFFFRRTALP